jgi:lipopolysaccharide/colanic/teichoic acid biosynthesis glycosyltransferase
MYRNGGKRMIDATVAGLILLIGSPLWLLVVLLVRLSLGTPIFFRQTRIGLNDRPFQLIKFRTMTDGRDARGELLSDAQRLTRFGRLLRKTSLDEVPQLWNVFVGEMSLIGPRPLLPAYLPRYSTKHRQRHLVRPGITGLAQVNGRNAIDWETKFDYDVDYVHHITLIGDVKIVVKTVLAVLKPTDVSADDHATMPEFKGGIINDEND